MYIVHVQCSQSTWGIPKLKEIVFAVKEQQRIFSPKQRENDDESANIHVQRQKDRAQKIRLSNSDNPCPKKFIFWDTAQTNIAEQGVQTATRQRPKKKGAQV